MKKINKKLLIALFVIVFSLGVVSYVKADSGWDTDYGGGGGYDGGGYDGGGYDSSGYSSSSHSGGKYETPLWLTIAIFAGYIVFLGSLVYIVNYKDIVKYKEKRSNRLNNTINIRSLKDLSAEQIMEFIPDMTIEKLKNMVYSNFVDIQNAWMNFDYDKLRELCTDELFNTYKAQLETLKLKKGKNIMSSFEMVEVKIIDAKVENDIIILTTYLCVNFYDYVINTETKKVIRGSKNHLVHNNYILTFVKSSKPGNKKKNNKCPNCGTPIKNNASNVCENCKSTIVKDSEEFVLSTKKIIN